MAETQPNPLPEPPPVEASSTPDQGRKLAGRFISLGAVAGVVALAFWVWSIIERHPRTDDAFAQANVIGVTPRVRGQIIKINVQDNQEVKEGDVLFEIDPADTGCNWRMPKPRSRPWISRLKWRVRKTPRSSIR